MSDRLPDRDPLRGGPSSAPPFARDPALFRLVFFAILLVLVVGFALLYANRTQQEVSSTAAVERARQNLPASELSPDTPEAQAVANRERIATLFEGALSDTSNGMDFAQTAGYRRLIGIIRKSSAEEFATRPKGILDYEKALRDPDAFRGEYVRARGLVVKLEAQKLWTPIDDLEDIYRGFLCDADGSEGIVFDVPERPGDVPVRSDAVDVEGIFYRTVRYETRRGEKKEIPYLLAKNVLRVETKEREGGAFNGPSPLAIGLLVLAMGIGIVIGYLARRSSRRPTAATLRKAGFREMFEQKLKKEGIRPGPKSPPDPAQKGHVHGDL